MEAYELEQVASAIRSASRELRSIRLRPADANTSLPNPSAFDMGTVGDLFSAITDLVGTLDSLNDALTPASETPTNG